MDIGINRGCFHALIRAPINTQTWTSTKYKLGLGGTIANILFNLYLNLRN
jgi:hypothetical protein